MKRLQSTEIQSGEWNGLGPFASQCLGYLLTDGPFSQGGNLSADSAHRNLSPREGLQGVSYGWILPGLHPEVMYRKDNSAEL